MQDAFSNHERVSHSFVLLYHSFRRTFLRVHSNALASLVLLATMASLKSSLTPMLRRSVVTRTTTLLRGGSSPPIPPFARIPVPSQKVIFAMHAFTLLFHIFSYFNIILFRNLVGGK